MDELIVECPHKLEGCETTCQRQLMPIHLKECLYGEDKDVRGLPKEASKNDHDRLEDEQVLSSL